MPSAASPATTSKLALQLWTTAWMAGSSESTSIESSSARARSVSPARSNIAALTILMNDVRAPDTSGSSSRARWYRARSASWSCSCPPPHRELTDRCGLTECVPPGTESFEGAVDEVLAMVDAVGQPLRRTPTRSRISGSSPWSVGNLSTHRRAVSALRNEVPRREAASASARAAFAPIVRNQRRGRGRHRTRPDACTVLGDRYREVSAGRVVDQLADDVAPQ